MAKGVGKILNTFVPKGFNLSMQPAFPYQIRGQQLWLSPHRCIFWEEERSLILSDLHFGKTGHFRKAGIAVPQSVYRDDLLRLLSLIQYFQPRQLLVVGDFFHSRENKELSLFRRWRDDFPDLGIRLILGNHDILHENWYEQAGITVSKDLLRIGAFAFIHDIAAAPAGAAVAAGAAAAPAGAAVAGAAVETAGMVGAAGTAGTASAERPYFFSGHLHPGIRIRGMGKQILQFPCFYFGAEYAVLPAFGHFTGTVSIDPLPESNVFAILPPAGREKGWPVQRHGRPGSRTDGSAAGLGGNANGPKERPRPASGPGSILQIQ